MKRQSLLLLGWLLLAIPVAVQAQFSYTVTNQTVTITRYTGTTSVVAIPSTIDGLPVTSVGVGAFSESTITVVTIPDSVTSIGVNAFYFCTKLTGITIPNGVTSIGDGAFEDCSSLTNFTIPNSVTDIGTNVFYFCTKLTGITIPNGVTSIGDNAFYGCGLTSVTIGNSITSIGDFAFSACSHLMAITVDTGNSVYSDVDGVLFDKSQTTLIQYPVGQAGTSYTIPNSVTSIGVGAFAISSLTNVAIPNSVTSIGEGAFYVCTGLSNVTIPNSVTSIEGNAFENCTNLANITFGSSVTLIGDGAFYGCSSLTSLTIPNSVTRIEANAFSGCTSLTNIIFGSGLTFIGSEAFSLGFGVLDTLDYYGCPLMNISIPNSVQIIGEGTFGGCSSLTNVTIGSGISYIASYAFVECSSLTGIYFQGNAPSFGPETVFGFDNPAKAYYLPGTTGWDSSFVGLATAPWTLPYPLILNNSFGVQSNQFGFTVSWATNLSVVVEASTNLSNNAWAPIQTNSLNNGVLNFIDPEWTKYPNRFYRVHSQ